LALGGLDPWLVAFGRAAVAGLLACGYLAAVRAPRPSRAQVRRLAIVALGVIVGFPLFTSLALVTSDAAHGAVVIAVLPAATALAAVARAGERPGLAFWLAAGAGLAIVLAFVLHEASGALTAADLFLLLGTALCALGYAEGGALARDLGGARTISWALVLSLPLTLPVTAGAALATGLQAGTSAWLGFAYVAVFSMFLGFFAWYAGLAHGGVARIGQIQLSQPLLSVLWAALVLGEQLSAGDADRRRRSAGERRGDAAGADRRAGAAAGRATAARAGASLRAVAYGAPVVRRRDPRRFGIGP
jgi:drug/metabolite transporter (DMT)-like permease